MFDQMRRTVQIERLEEVVEPPVADGSAVQARRGHAHGGGLGPGGQGARPRVQLVLARLALGKDRDHLWAQRTVERSGLGKGGGNAEGKKQGMGCGGGVDLPWGCQRPLAKICRQGRWPCLPWRSSTCARSPSSTSDRTW